MAFAVYLSMKAANASPDLTLITELQAACLAEGTVEQCLALQEDLDRAGHAAEANQMNALVAKVASEPSAALASKAASLLATMKQRGHKASEEANEQENKQPAAHKEQTANSQWQTIIILTPQYSYMFTHSQYSTRRK